MEYKNEHLSEVEGKPLPDDVPSLWQTFSSTSSRHPDNIAIASLQQPAGLYQIESKPPLENIHEYDEKPWLRWTYRNLIIATRRLQRALEERGLEPGAPLFTFLDAGVEFPLCLWTSHAKRCCFAPLSPKNLTNLPEVAHMMDAVLKAAADEKPFIVAGSEVIARQIESLPVARGATKIVLGDSDAPAIDGWERLGDLMMKAASESGDEATLEESPGPEDVPGPSADQIVFFTSGTTALPKGCLWKYPAGALYLEQRLRRAKHITPASKVCVPIPSNHGAAWYWFTPTLCQGGTVVYPGPSSSDPSAIVRALRLERCTDAIVVPTMVHALALAAQSSSSSSLELGCLSLAGSPCTPAHLDEAMRALGARTVENAWGMTENVLIPSGACADPKTVLLDEARRHVSVGTVPDGLRLKVCAPGGYDPVPRGTPGELHFSSRILTREYIGIESPGFYDDDDERDDARWFRTGDQARIDADGRVFVVGRYKDMIIRGAENMAPAAIEAVIATEERLGSSCLDVQVVGCPDAVAGEVPVVVSREALAARLFELLRETVAARMGPQYVPVEVLTLRDLGLDEWPRTIIGKLQKNQVAARVRQYVERRDALSLAGRSRNDEASLETIVRQIWARSTGAADLDMLPVDRPISEFADSITIMRVRDRIARETGHVLSLAALTEAGTIAKQLELLRNQELHRKVEKVTRETPGANPPGGDLVKAEDMVHVNEVFEATQTAILDTIQPHGLDWGDVMEVTPAYDFLEVSSRSDAIDSWSPKWALVCRSGISPEQVTAAIRASILKHPIFNSFFVRESESMALYVILRQKEELLGKVIVNGGKLKSEDDLISALRETIQPDPTMVPGPMAHFRLFTIEDTNSVGIIMKLNHLICDATSSQIFLDDLDTSLAAGRAAAPRQQHHTTPYKTWSDAYHRCRRSPEARAAVSWHLQHLGDLAAHRDALWPRPRPDLHENLLRASGARDAQAHAFDCTGLHGLLLRRGKLVTASVVAKTAYALATVRTTGLSHALFTSNEAARVNDVVVAGPCYTKVVNLVHVRREEALASLLRRMQRVQDDQTRCAAAPWRDVMEGLGAGAGDVLVEANWCSTFNWVPGSGVAGGAWLDHGSVVRVVGFCVRLRNGLTMACALEGSGGKERMLMDLRGTGLDAKGMASFAERFEKIVRWMCREENWHANVGQAMNVR